MASVKTMRLVNGLRNGSFTDQTLIDTLNANSDLLEGFKNILSTRTDLCSELTENLSSLGLIFRNDKLRKLYFESREAVSTLYNTPLSCLFMRTLPKSIIDSLPSKKVTYATMPAQSIILGIETGYAYSSQNGAVITDMYSQFKPSLKVIFTNVGDTMDGLRSNLAPYYRSYKDVFGEIPLNAWSSHIPVDGPGYIYDKTFRDNTFLDVSKRRINDYSEHGQFLTTNNVLRNYTIDYDVTTKETIGGVSFNHRVTRYMFKVQHDETCVPFKKGLNVLYELAVNGDITDRSSSINIKYLYNKEQVPHDRFHKNYGLWGADATNDLSLEYPVYGPYHPNGGASYMGNPFINSGGQGGGPHAPITAGYAPWMMLMVDPVYTIIQVF